MLLIYPSLIFLLLSVCAYSEDEEENMYDSGKEVEAYKVLFCDTSKAELKEEVDKCFEDVTVKDEKKITEIIKSCSENLKDMTAKSFREAICEKEDEKVVEIIECLEHAFEDEDEESEDYKLFDDLGECLVDSLEKHGNLEF